MLSQVTGRPQDAAQETELLEHSARIAGRSVPRGRGGFWLPHELVARLAGVGELQERAVGKGVGGNLGAALVPLQHQAALFETSLRSRMVFAEMGVRVIPGLVGDASIPIALTDPTAEWVTEGAGSGSSDPSFAAGVMSPHTLRARVDVTRRMLIQGVPAVDQLIAESLMSTIALALEAAIFSGSGVGAEPEGVLNTSGIGTPAYVTTNGTTEYDSLVDAATLVADADADLGSTGFVVTSGIRGRLQKKLVDAGSGIRIWEEGSAADQIGRIAGFRAGVTNTLPRNLGVGTNEHSILYGDWSQVLVGLGSGVDLVPDDVTLGDSGGVVWRAFQDVDVLVRRAAAFAAMQVNPTA